MASIEHLFLTGHEYPCIYMASIQHTFLTGHKSTYDHTQLHFFLKLEFYLSIFFLYFYKSLCNSNGYTNSKKLMIKCTQSNTILLSTTIHKGFDKK